MYGSRRRKLSKTLDRLRRREQNPLGPETAEPAAAASRGEQAFSPTPSVETPELSSGMLQILRHEVEQEKALLAHTRADAQAREEELLRNIAELKSHSTALSLKLAEATEQAELSEATRNSLANRTRETENRLNRHITELEKEAQVSAMRITQLSHALDEMQNLPASRHAPAASPQKQAIENLMTAMPAIHDDDADGIAAKLKQAEDQRKHLEDDLAAREKKLGRKIADMEASIRDLTKELSEAKEQARQARRVPAPTAGRTMRKVAQAVVLLGAVVAGAIFGRFSGTIPSPMPGPAAPPALASPPALAQTDVSAPLIPREPAVPSLPANVAAEKSLPPNTLVKGENPPRQTGCGPVWC